MGRHVSLAGLWLAILTCLAGPLGAEAMRVEQAGHSRLYWIEDGRPDKNQAAPLVLAIHGYRTQEEALALRDNPQDLAWRRLRELAQQEGFIAVFPAAHLGQWNLFDGLPRTDWPDGGPIDDVAFLLNIVTDYVNGGDADPDRLYITGISDGAIMTYRLICRADTPFAAAAPLIGSAYGGHLADCQPDRPSALMHVHGTHDAVLPYEGWIFPGGREVSVPEVMEHWRLLHGCTGQAGQMLEDIDPEDGSRVGEMTWTGCDRSDSVKRYKVIGGGHDVPDAKRPQRGEGERRFNRDLDTYPVMWRFFQANPRMDR